MGKFEIGNPGRPKGSKNRMTQTIREQIQNLFDDNFETIQWAQQVTPQTVRNWINQGKIKSQRIGRPILITENNLREFLKIE